MDKKLYECSQCGKLVPIRSKNLCAYCRYKQQGNQTKNYQIKRQTSKNKLKKEEKRAILEPFFNFHLKNIAKNPFCENCGCRIQGNLCNIAHIIPKGYGRHPEVMGEIDNCIYLCASVNGGEEIGCHERMDRIQTTSSIYNMNCWNKLLERYIKFKEKCIRRTKYTEIFEDYLNESNK